MLSYLSSDGKVKLRCVAKHPNNNESCVYFADHSMPHKTSDNLTWCELERKELEQQQGTGPNLSLRELGENIVRGLTKEPRPCRRCGEVWIPGDWNFYDLCNYCFILFNTQKMNGRFSRLQGFDQNPTNPYFESCEDWIKAFPIESVIE